MADKEIKFTSKELDSFTKRALAEDVLIEGARPLSWWKKQSNDLHAKFMNEMRTSIENGESVQKAAVRVRGGTVNGVQVPGIMKASKAQAATLSRTAINKVSNEARIQSFAANDDIIKAIKQISTLDAVTSLTCVAYDGQVWQNTARKKPVPPSTLPFNAGPPRHFNCRSTLVPVLKSWKELGIKANELSNTSRASMDGQVPADTTFSDFLKGKTKTFQDNLLGKTKARLWRTGKIKLNQLVDFRGNPLSDEQLLALAKKAKAAAAATAAAAAAPKPKPAPAPKDGIKEIPVWKNGAEAEQWLKDNLLAENNYGIGWIKTYDRGGLRIMAEVTLDMQRRFGLRLPTFLGNSQKHPKYRFKKSQSLASVHMESDALMFGTRGISIKRSAADTARYKEASFLNWRNGKNLPKDADYKVDGLQARNAKEVKAKYSEDKALVRATEQAAEVGNEFTAYDFSLIDAEDMIRKTFIHESGHRFHAHHLKELNQILQTEPGFLDHRHRYLWFRSTSEYATTNSKEFVAEQFVHYNQGNMDRVWPPLKKFFKKHDKDS